MSNLNIYVACGSGIATSTVAANKIEDIVKEIGISRYKINKISMTELPSVISSADVVFTTNRYKGEHEVPVMSVVPFITGIREEATKEKVRELLEEVMKNKGDNK